MLWLCLVVASGAAGCRVHRDSALFVQLLVSLKLFQNKMIFKNIVPVQKACINLNIR